MYKMKKNKNTIVEKFFLFGDCANNFCVTG